MNPDTKACVEQETDLQRREREINAEFTERANAVEDKLESEHGMPAVVAAGVASNLTHALQMGAGIQAQIDAGKQYGAGELLNELLNVALFMFNRVSDALKLLDASLGTVTRDAVQAATRELVKIDGDYAAAMAALHAETAPAEVPAGATETVSGIEHITV